MRSKEYVLMVHFAMIRFDGASGACQERPPDVRSRRDQMTIGHRKTALSHRVLQGAGHRWGRNFTSSLPGSPDPL